MAQYRKKPVIVEATQWDGTMKCAAKLIVDYPQIQLGLDCGMLKNLVIPTLEGNHLASPKDYIIQGVQGEIYPCKPDIFELTYEKVETD